jgi:hypothetical protein
MSYQIYPQNVTYGNVTLSTPNTTGSTYTWNGVGTSAWDVSYTNPVTITQKATIDLKGEDADVIINGESLKDAIKEIKDALRIPGKIQHDAQLERDWDELKAAGDHYEKLRKEYREKQKVWNTLKNKNL